MATTSHGLTYPTTGSNVRVPQDIQQLAEDVNDNIDELLGAWQSYSPSWASTGTAPSLGNGTLVGRYSQVGKVVRVSVRLLMGSTTTPGTGAYSISLPVASAAVSGLHWIGSAYCRDASATSAGHFPAICVLDAGSTVVSFFNVFAQVSHTHPFTWANADHLSFSIVYQAA